ncbi:MAG: hypothetical protein GDA51_03265 [Ekhidna sp.]|nr:hypothetical protein [Ekhidna sp.]
MESLSQGVPSSKNKSECFAKSREDYYGAIIVILNLQGFENLESFSNIIINNGSFSSSKHVCVHQRKLRESGEPVARCPVLKKQK